MRGSISRLSQKLGCGFIVGENGREACFDLSSLEGVDIRALSVGETVEYEGHFGNERLRAVRVRVMPTPSSKSASGVRNEEEGIHRGINKEAPSRLHHG